MTRVIRPEILVTKSYLDNVITFNPDERFIESSIIKPDSGQRELTRDISEHVVVILNSATESLFKIEMVSKLFNRKKVAEISNSKFTELANAQ